MSDLRSRLIAAFVKWEWASASISHESFVDTILPIIEVELQKRDQEIANWKFGANDALDCAQQLAAKLTEANKLLDQTAGVLEGLVKQTFPTNDYACPMCGGTWDYPVERHTFRCPYGKAKPLLDNLKALKKEGTE